MSDIMAMVTSGTSNDVKIVLEDGEIMANKDVLIARSDYFATMFSNYKDVKFVEGETNKVDMGHCSKVVMEKIIKYLFSGDMKLHDLTLPDLLKMLNITSMMMMHDIYADVKEYVLELIPDSGLNCAYLPVLVNSLMFAENFGLEEIQEALVQELYVNLKDVPHIPEVVQNSEAFKRLPANTLKEILLFEEWEVEEDIQDAVFKPGTGKRRSPSKTKRAGLVFPVSRINNRIKESKYAKRLGKGADVYMAAVLEYLVAEVTELAGGHAQ